MEKYIFHSDAGHSWLQVPKSELKELGIKDKISKCSYMEGDIAYLEEDCDATVFIKAFCESICEKPNRFKDFIEEKYEDGLSVIRQMDTYKEEG